MLNELVETAFRRTDAPMSFLERMTDTVFECTANLLESISTGPSISRDGSVHTCDNKIKVNISKLSNLLFFLFY